MARGITEAFIDISPNFSGFAGKLSEGINFAFGSSLATVAAAFDKVGKAGVKKFSIPLAVATAANIAQFQALEAEINTVLTLFGTAPALIDETFGEMSKGIREVATEVGGLEKDIAGGLYQAISAGVPEENVFEFLEVAQMAAMADRAADLETAVDGISTAVNAFSAENLTAARASDILFAGVAVGKTTLDELGSSIGRSAGLAANAGVKFSEFIAVIAEMTKSGVATAEAVSFMRAAITGLLRPSEEMDAIFQEIGFATAEAAVPVIGLQSALETVSAAADGSTSKLQELLGSSEAVTAVLAVTGEKAEAFAGTLNTVENAAGNTERAYDIMQRGIGRSFGRLTESFDRLGNLFGEMGAQIVQPFVNFLGELVSSLVTVFSTLTPLAVTLGKAIEGLFKVFDIPIVGFFVRVLVSAALAISAIFGVLSPLVLLLAQFLKLMVSHFIIAAFAKAIDAASKVLAFLEIAMAKNVIVAKILTPVLNAVKKALEFVGIAATRTAITLVASFVAVAAFAAAAFIAVKVFTAWRLAAEEAAKQNDIFGDGVSRLLDSAGIIENELPKAFASVEGAIDNVRDKNFRLLAEFEELIAKFGNIATGDVLLSIGAELVWKGATPEQAFEIMRMIGAESGVPIQMDLGDFTEQVQSIEIRFAGLRVLARDIQQTLAEWDPDLLSHGLVATSIDSFEQLASAIATTISVAGDLGELPLLKGELIGLENIINDGATMQLLFKSIIAIMEEAAGEKFDVELTGVDTVEKFFDELERVQKIPDLDNIVLPGIDTDLARDIDVEATSRAAIDAIEEMGPKIEGVITLTGEQPAALAALWKDMDGAFAAANTHIAESQAAITESLMAQIPVFAEYTEAVALSASSLADSAAAWTADLQVVADGTALLADNLTPAEIKIFNEQSIADQASFFKGHTEALAQDAKEGTETAQGMFENLKTTMSTLGLEEIKIGSEIDRIMGEADTILETALNALITTAEAAGTKVPEAFLIKFNAGKVSMGESAEAYMSTLEGIVGADISGPTITAPTFIGGSTTYTVNVTSTGSANPGKDVSRALLNAGSQAG